MQFQQAALQIFAQGDYTFIKNIIKNIKLQMFPIASFYFEHFLFYVTVIMVHTQLWTKQSNVRTNSKHSLHAKAATAFITS